MAIKKETTEGLIKKITKKYVITSLVFNNNEYTIGFTDKERWFSGKDSFRQAEDGKRLNNVLKKIATTNYTF